MNILIIIALLIAAFFAVALYYSLKFPNGKWFGTRRDKLLRKTGPSAKATLENLNVRFLSRAGGQIRLMLNAVYSYQIKETKHEITLPLESAKLPNSSIKNAKTSTEFEREIPEQLELENGTQLEGRESIRLYFLDQLRQKHPSVTVIYDKHSPDISTVRDWH
jgi:hypothetical protein